MPSASKAQYRLMSAAAKNKKFAEARGIDHKVAKEWHAEDKKKREEDPDWYKNLPDTKGPKEEKEASEPSMEGLFDSLKSMFSASMKPQPGKNVTDTTQALLKELRKDASLLKPEHLRDGTIQVASHAGQIGLINWSNNWLSDVERILKVFENWLPKYFMTRTDYSHKVRDIYKKAEAIGDATKAAGYAVPAIGKEQAKLIDKISKFPTFPNFAYAPVDTPHGIQLSRVHVAMAPHYIPALSMGEAKKVLQLLQLCYEILDKSFDARDDEWCLDDTDEIKWWQHHSPDNEDYMKFINLLPYAGEWAEFELDDYTILGNIERGLVGIFTASLKK